MDRKNKIIEDYCQKVLKNGKGHDWEHSNRVRRWALLIAKEERIDRLDLVEAAALLHDIGRPKASSSFGNHGHIGAKMAREFLTENRLFPEGEIEQIVEAIKEHNTNKSGISWLHNILQDADILDGMGPIYIIRVARAGEALPICDENNVKSETWNTSLGEFNQHFKVGKKPIKTVVDDLNFGYSTYSHLHSETAKEIAKPYRKFLHDYIKLLEKQISLIAKK